MPKHERVRFTREQLYELVWSRPMTDIAADFGMSSNAFARHCRKLNVPPPPRGYWARVRFGYRPKQTALPKPRKTTPDAIEVTKYDVRPPPPPMIAPDIVVADRLVQPHPTLVQIRECLRRPDGTEGNVILGNGHPVLRVAFENKLRALCILDALFKAFDSMGAASRLSASERARHRHALHIHVADRPPVELWLTEHMERAAHVETDFEKRWGFGRKWDQAFSGELIIEVGAPFAAGGLRRRWSDTSTRIEDKLGEVVIGVHRAADAIKAHEDELDRRRHEDELKRLREREVERLHEHRDALGRDLREMASRWKEATTLRAFLAAIDAEVPTPRSSNFEAWLTWARTVAEELDPLKGTTAIAKSLTPEVSHAERGQLNKVIQC